MAQASIQIFQKPAEALVFCGQIYVGRIFRANDGFRFLDANEKSVIANSQKLSPHDFADKCAEALGVINPGIFQRAVYALAPEYCPACLKNHAQAEHVCPYSLEFCEEGEVPERCTCCQECEDACSYNI